MANRNVYDPTPNHDIDFDIMTIREYLNTLSDKEYAEEVMDYARTLLAEFSRSSRPLTVKDQDFRFSGLNLKRLCLNTLTRTAT